MLLVDGWRLSDHTNSLWRVFLNVLVCARIDKVELEIGRSICRCTRGRQIPPVDIVVTQVVDFCDGSMERCQRIEMTGEGCSFRNEQRWRAMDCTKESNATSSLI